MTWQEELGLKPGEELRSGASNPEDEYLDGISPKKAAKLAEDILADPLAPSSTPGNLTGTRRETDVRP